MNDKIPLTFDFKTLCESTRLDYNQGTYGLEAVLSKNYSSTEQVNSIQQFLAYCLLTGTKVDIVSSLPTFEKKKKKKSQIVSQPKPKTQVPEASGVLSQKRKNPKTQKTPIVQATETPPTEKGTRKSKPFPKGKPTDVKDLEGNIQPAGIGLSSTPLDEGTRKSNPFPEGKTNDPKDSEGNKQPVDMGLPFTIPDEVKEDPALNKKVLKATKAYTKNSTNLTEIHTPLKTFDFSVLKSIIVSLKADVDA
ncbi:hypothetical protein Tco_0909573 [Tanacetum coccineum]|uniref:Uncharacterized protein n=1 Tax=Tanacetum coccineum TaxID=301880 RepID=A0ABQ5CSJ8_9ASTR